MGSSSGSSRKRKGSLANKNEKEEDRLSALPDALLHQILSFLTTHQVVQTCVLSKRWKYVWASVPFLHFDLDIFSLFKSESTYRFLANPDPTILQSFTVFINQVLSRHNCSHIVSFRFRSQYAVTLDPCIVQSWISYAIERQVQQLDITTSYFKQQPVVLSRFFSCQSLTSLKLDCYNGVVEMPNSYGLSSLKTLHLESFSVLDGAIFSSCPLLETLILGRISVKNLEIHALNLKVLKFLAGCRFEVMIFAPKLTSLEFHYDVPLVRGTYNLVSLEDVTVDFHLLWAANYLKEQLGLRLVDMLNELHNAKSIILGSYAVEVLSAVPAILSEKRSAFPDLKYLKLKTDEWCKSFNVPAFILNYFLNDSTSLKVCS